LTTSSSRDVKALIARPGFIGLILDEKNISEGLAFYVEILSNSKKIVDRDLG
jgi:hypothetical protein